MDGCTWSPCHKHCCIMPMQPKLVHRHLTPHPSSILAHPICAFGRPITRCSCFGHCPYVLNTTRDAGLTLERSLDTAGTPVLARRETDGYFYQGTIVKGPESGTGTLLVQFATPFSVDGDAARVQQTASGDVLECVNGMRHSILPGDKVLAPWEPGQKRYGPGTVLRGMETRDPLREKEDEEITVSFWNGKKATVPRGVALWISPLQWRRIVEMIHMPHTSRKQWGGPLRRASCHVCSCGPVAACTCACTLGDLQQSHWPYCSFPSPCYSCFHHSCSLLGHMLHTPCSCPKYSDCWWQPSSAKIPQGNMEEEISSKPTPKLLALEGPPKEEPATAPSSPSSDSESSGEMSLTKSTMVDHAVNTDCSLFEQPKLQAIRRPDWKYWRRSHPRAHCKSQGTRHFP